MTCLNPDYATTRNLTPHRPESVKDLPANEARVAEGGLRKQGHYKVSLPGKPLITIITVVLNRARCLESCISSVIGQSYDNVEYIVIDGASTDGTVDLLRKYNDRIDYWVSEPDQGLYYAMNKGVEVASGDWLYFIGSDDLMLDCLAEVVPNLKGEKSIYYGDVYYLGQKRVFNGPFSRYRFNSLGINHQGILYPRSVFAKYRYDVTYSIVADWDLNIRCYLDSGYSFSYLQTMIAEYNDLDGLSTDSSRIYRTEYRVMIRRRLGPGALPYIFRYSLVDFLQLIHCKEPLIRLIRACERRFCRKNWRYPWQRFSYRPSCEDSHE